MNVLVVEDEPVDLKLTLAVLGAAGFTVYGVPSAEQALPIVRGRNFDVIITDLALPQMDGIALAHEIRTAGPNARTPIIAASAFLDEFEARGSLGGGEFSRLLRKPVDIAALPLLVSATCNPA